VPYIIHGASWNRIPGDKPTAAGEINAYLEANPEWILSAERMSQQMKPEGCLNLDPDAAGILNILSSTLWTYGNRTTDISGLLSMLSRSGIPVFLGSIRSVLIEGRLRIERDPVEMAVDLQTSENELTLHLGYARGCASTTSTCLCSTNCCTRMPR
jgi:hypothetical protein